MPHRYWTWRALRCIDHQPQLLVSHTDIIAPPPIHLPGHLKDHSPHFPRIAVTHLEVVHSQRRVGSVFFGRSLHQPRHSRATLLGWPMLVNILKLNTGKARHTRGNDW